MDYIFKPKNHSAAWIYFVTLPNYKFWDFLQKKIVIFKDSEIKSVEKIVINEVIYKIYFETNRYEGFFVHKGDLDESLFKMVDANPYKNLFSLKQVVNSIKNFFSIQSPMLWVFVSIFFAAFFADYLSAINPKTLANAVCNTKCVKSVLMSSMMLTMIVFLPLLQLVLSSFFYFYESTKIRNVQKYYSVRSTSFLMMIVSALILFTSVPQLAENHAFEKIPYQYRLIYKPEYFKDANNRKIASEVLKKGIPRKK